MKTRRLARTALVATLSALSLAAAGCGNKEEVTTEAKTEGIWIDAGALDYHVQGSRVLEPGQTPDSAYLKGLPDGVAEPKGDEVWFAVFLRVENRTEQPAITAKEFEIIDTVGHTFTPYGLDPNENPFAYSPTTLGQDEAIPAPDSPQEFNSFSGAELLFKIPLDAYQNRPLEFKIHAADGSEPAEASLDLDV
jgi:hypothetical protein